MTKDEIFDILNIAETKDENLLKLAYREQLSQHNPEDDPEGFKKLRMAYEEACQLAKASSDDNPSQILSDGEKWIVKANEQYASLSGRQDVERWRDWLSDDYCVALDTAEEAKERFMNFIMNHFYYPDAVWQLFDKEFQLRNSKNELLEQYPENFIDYIIWTIENGTFIDFSLFEGDDNADVDNYIAQYYTLKAAVDHEDATLFDETLNQLKTYPLHHTYVDVECMKMAIYHQNDMEVENYAVLFEAREDTNDYIRLSLAKAYEYLDNWEAAKSIYDALIVDEPDLYPARLGQVRVLVHEGNNEDAKEQVLLLLDINKNDAEAEKLMIAINERLIEKLTSRQATLSVKEQIDLGWCYLQNEQYDKTLSIIENLQPDEKTEDEYNNLAGRIYFYTNNYQKAYPYLEAWLKALEAIDDSDTEKVKRKRRIPYATFCVGLCCQKIYADNQDASLIEKSKLYIDRAIDSETDITMRFSYMVEKAQCLNNMKQFAQAVDLCDAIIAQDSHYLPAYIVRQEAFFELKQAQNVLDDYYRIIKLYPSYVKTYILAIKVYMIYDQYDDALEIIKEAERAGITSDYLTYLKARCRHYQSYGKAELANIIDEIAATYEKLLNSEELDSKDMERLHLDYLEALMAKHEYVKALEYTEKFMEKYPNNPTLLWIYADLLQYTKRYIEAQEAYKRAKPYFYDTPAMLCDLARCMIINKEYEGAISELEEALTYNESREETLELLERAYHDLLNTTDQEKYFQKALPYATKLLEQSPSDYNYIQRGILYQDGAQWELAIPDFKKALEINPSSGYAYNNLGFSYRLLGRFSDAVEMFEHALAIFKEQNESIELACRNLAITHLIMGNYDQARDYIMEGFKEKRNYSANLLAGEVYIRKENYPAALKVYDAMLKIWPEQADAIQIEIFKVYLAKVNIYKAGHIIEQLYKKNPEDIWIFKQYIEFYADTKRNYRQVLKLFSKIPKIDDQQILIDLQHYYIEALYRTGKKAEASNALEKAILMLKDYGEERYYGINNPLMYYYNIALCYLFGGQPEQAKVIIDKMLYSNRCRLCRYSKCFEGLYLKGYYELLHGRVDSAYTYFEEAYKVNPLDDICRYYGKKKRKKL